MLMVMLSDTFNVDGDWNYVWRKICCCMFVGDDTNASEVVTGYSIMLLVQRTFMCASKVLKTIGMCLLLVKQSASVDAKAEQI
jgi:hypothetical protein